MACDQPDCEAPVTHMYTWPGRTAMPTCSEHLDMHKGIAMHAGLEMDVVELFEPDES